MRSWEHISDEWIRLIDGKSLRTGSSVTDRAIVSCISRISPKRVLDVGCGEGWLTGQILKQGIPAHGIDATMRLIVRAQERYGDHFSCVTYADMPHQLPDEDFDCCVCNFSLLGDETTSNCISGLSEALTTGARLIVQTLHPCFSQPSESYLDHWTVDSRAVKNLGLSRPLPYRFRTLESWIELFTSNSFVPVSIKEPSAEPGHQPCSILFELNRL